MADHVVQGEGDLYGNPGKEGTDGLLAVVDPKVAAPIPDGIVCEERGEAIGVIIVGVTQLSVAYLEPPNVFKVLKPLDAFLQSGHHALLILATRRPRPHAPSIVRASVAWEPVIVGCRGNATAIVPQHRRVCILGATPSAMPPAGRLVPSPDPTVSYNHTWCHTSTQGG